MRRDALKQLYESHTADAGVSGVREAQKRFATDLINRIPTINVAELSLKQIFDITVMESHPDLDLHVSSTVPVSEAMGDSLFPKITKEVINKEFMPAFESGVKDVMNLVSVMQTDETAFDFIAGTTAKSSMLKVEVGHNYPFGEFGEKSVRISLGKWGQIIPLELELVIQDKTGTLLQRARDFAAELADVQHRLIVETVVGVTRTIFKETTAGGYYYNGSVRTLYSANHATVLNGYTNQNLSATTALSTDGLDVMFGLTAIMQDEEGKYVATNPNLLLVHPRYEQKAWNLVNCATRPDSGNRADNFYSRFNYMSTPYLNTGGGNTTDYYLGNFPRQFVWMDVWKPRIDTQGSNSNAAFERDVVYQFKVSQSGGCAARDSRFVIKATAA